MFGVYKSQSKSWLLILLPYLLNIILRKSAYIYTLNESLLDYKKPIINKLKGKPLYEIHERCKKFNWFKHIDKDFYDSLITKPPEVFRSERYGRIVLTATVIPD